MHSCSLQAATQHANVVQVQGMLPRTPLSAHTERRLARLRGDVAPTEAAGGALSGNLDVLAARLPSRSPAKPHAVPPQSLSSLRVSGGRALAPLVDAGNSPERAPPAESGKPQRAPGGFRLASSYTAAAQPFGRQPHAAGGQTMRGVSVPACAAADKQADAASDTPSEGRRQSQIPR